MTKTGNGSSMVLTVTLLPPGEWAMEDPIEEPRLEPVVSELYFALLVLPKAVNPPWPLHRSNRSFRGCKVVGKLILKKLKRFMNFFGEKLSFKKCTLKPRYNEQVCQTIFFTISNLICLVNPQNSLYRGSLYWDLSIYTFWPLPDVVRSSCGHFWRRHGWRYQRLKNFGRIRDSIFWNRI